MLTKFDVRSCRVKGVSFHPARSWVLCGMHNGTIQIWDYLMNTSVDAYEEHTGSVRGVDFHQSQPLFVSGADDYLIKVWNYKLRRCLFTLVGHMDYIRCTFFHHNQPWILSASDDFTVRVWNWQSRCVVASLPGHNHYVLCAQFHPREDLVASSSLDTTIRVWDISALRNPRQETGLTHDLLGTSDVVLRYQLDGHEKGVNWVAFHPTKPYLLSASDDRSVRVWRLGDNVYQEDIQLRGHTNNVSCVMYFKDYIISNGEDRSIRVWDMSARSPIMVFRRESDRYWILAAHPTNNLIAAGHDSGLQVFKLFRERPAWTVHNNVLYFVREQSLRSYDFETTVEANLMNLRGHQYPPITISCNPADNMAVLWYDTDGGVYALFTIPRQGTSTALDMKKGFYTNAVFFSAHKFAVVDKAQKVVLRTTQSDAVKVLNTDFSCTSIFPGPLGFIVCRTADEKIYMYQIAQHCSVAETTVPGVKYVVWDKDFNKVAFLAKNAITVMSKRFKPITAILESSVRVKSAAFDEERDILYYTTSNHLKYCNLRSGECSTIRTLQEPVYLVKARGDTIWIITRDGKVVTQTLENTELNFKLMLQQQSYREVLKIIQKKKLKGQALVGYLYKHGHLEIALHFASDPVTRFNLAVECGAVDIAKTMAMELNKPEIWRRLGETATRYGDIQLAQFAHSKVHNYYGVGLHCILSGNMDALDNLVESVEDRSFKLHYGMYSGNVLQRVKTLVDAGQLPLAYATAKANGFHDEAAELLEKMEPQVAQRAQQIQVHPPLKRPTVKPVMENWPMLQVEESMFARLLRDPGRFDTIAETEAAQVDVGAAWDEDDDDLFQSPKDAEKDDAASSGGDEGDGWDDDLDIDTSTLPQQDAAQAAAKGVFVVPREGEALPKHWTDHYNIAAYHIAAGSFATAMDILRRQIGLADPRPLHPYMMNLWMSVSSSLPTWIGQSTIFSLASMPPPEEMRARHAPMLPSNGVQVLAERVKQASAAFVEGRFADAHALYVSVVHQVPLTVVPDKKAHAELQEIFSVCREYTQALNIQLKLRSCEPASTEALELSLYFTHFKMSPTHLNLALTQAMSKAYKKRNLKSAEIVARRLLDLDPIKKKADQARIIIAEAESNPSNAVQIDYDERNPFVVCSVSMRPLYRGVMEPIRCSYCFAPANKEYKGQVCQVCCIATYGADAAGLISGAFQLN